MAEALWLLKQQQYDQLEQQLVIRDSRSLALLSARWQQLDQLYPMLLAAQQQQRQAQQQVQLLQHQLQRQQIVLEHRQHACQTRQHQQQRELVGQQLLQQQRQQFFVAREVWHD